MTTKTITALPAGTALGGTEVAPFDQGASTVKITATQIKDFSVNQTSILAILAALDEPAVFPPDNEVLMGTATAATTIAWLYGGYPPGPDPLVALLQDYAELVQQTEPYAQYGNFNAVRYVTANVNPTDDDPQYNVYAAEIMRSSVPNTNSKNISEVYGSISSAQFNGSGTLSYLVGHFANTGNTSPVDSVVGFYGNAEIAADAAFASGCKGWVDVVGAVDVGEASTLQGQINVATGATVDKFYGAQITFNVAGSVTNAYGIWCQDLAIAGVTNKWFLYYAGGRMSVDGAGICDATGYKVGGVAGLASFSGAVTNITVVNGIITAAS